MTVHINRPESTRFIAQTRKHGCRNWTTHGAPSRSETVAAKRAVDAMRRNRHKRGRVLLVADYYDPIVLWEMRR